MVYDQSEESAAAERALFKALRQIHRRAGEPSSRAIASAIGGMSHTTVNSLLKGTKIPSWPILAKVVEQLGGDLPEFQRLWIETRESSADAPTRPAPRSEISVFVSYARVDDEATYGRVSKLVSDIGNTYESMTGQTVGVFLDIESIAPGEDWKDRIRLGLSSSSIFLAVVTPAFLRSTFCREELSEFFGFLDANANARLVMPLVYTDRKRIEVGFANDPLWKKISQRQPIDISGLRFVDVGSAEWVRETTRIAEAIESILADESSGDEKGDPRNLPAPPESADGLIERFADIEESMPLAVGDMERFSSLLDQLNQTTVDATPAMNKATSFGQKLAVTTSLANSLSPIANEMKEVAERIVDTLNEWDTLVNWVIGQARNDPDFYSTSSNVEFLGTVHDMAAAGVESLASIEQLDTAIGSILGLSKRLDVPLRTMRQACLNMADLRGLLAGWKFELEALEESPGSASFTG
jgi:hypothetical protein